MLHSKRSPPPFQTITISLVDNHTTPKNNVSYIIHNPRTLDCNGLACQDWHQEGKGSQRREHPATRSEEEQSEHSDTFFPNMLSQDMLTSHQSIEDIAAFLRIYKKLQNDNENLAAELQETKPKLNTAEIDRINDYEDLQVVH
jgi:hypothetical protein